MKNKMKLYGAEIVVRILPVEDRSIGTYHFVARNMDEAKEFARSKTKYYQEEVRKHAGSLAESKCEYWATDVNEIKVPGWKISLEKIAEDSC